MENLKDGSNDQMFNSMYLMANTVHCI